MKRTLALLCAVLFMTFVSGCGDNTREDAVTGVITVMKTAASDVRTIHTKVKDAVKKADNDPAKLDLSDAAKAAENLEKETGKFAQARKRDIEAARTGIDEKEKQDLAERFREGINSAFRDLVKERDELKVQLDAAERLNKEK